MCFYPLLDSHVLVYFETASNTPLTPFIYLIDEVVKVVNES